MMAPVWYLKLGIDNSIGGGESNWHGGGCGVEGGDEQQNRARCRHHQQDPAGAVTVDKVEPALKNDLGLSCEADTFVFGKNVDGGWECDAPTIGSVGRLAPVTGTIFCWFERLVIAQKLPFTARLRRIIFECLV
jgi:hypothetical protein